MKKHRKLFLIVGLLGIVGTETQLDATGVIDQQQPVIDVSVGGLGIGGNSQEKLAQVVTAGMSGFLTELRFPISCYQADLIVEVQGVQNGQPDAIVLTSEHFSGTGLPSFFPNPGVVSFRSFAFSRPVLFSAGDQFAIVLRSTATNAFADCGIFRGPPGDSYAGGQGFFDARPNPEGIWVCICEFAGDRFDLPFQTVVAPLVQEVDIDIRPREFPNNINRKSDGKIPVAILSTRDFDAPAQVDRASLTFGSTGDEASLSHYDSLDVNGDGLLDLVALFNTQQTHFGSNDTAGVLKGRTITGSNFSGTDSVRIVH